MPCKSHEATVLFYQFQVIPEIGQPGRGFLHAPGKVGIDKMRRQYIDPFRPDDLCFRQTGQILAGFFIDVGILDEYLPMNQAMGLLIDTAFKGLSLLDVWQRILKLLGFSVIAMLAASYIFSKKPTLG